MVDGKNCRRRNKRKFLKIKREHLWDEYLFKIIQHNLLSLSAKLSVIQ